MRRRERDAGMCAAVDEERRHALAEHRCRAVDDGGARAGRCAPPRRIGMSGPGARATVPEQLRNPVPPRRQGAASATPSCAPKMPPERAVIAVAEHLCAQLAVTLTEALRCLAGSVGTPAGHGPVGTTASSSRTCTGKVCSAAVSLRLSYATGCCLPLSSGFVRKATTARLILGSRQHECAALGPWRGSKLAFVEQVLLQHR